jgi:hypothetical protein
MQSVLIGSEYPVMDTLLFYFPQSSYCNLYNGPQEYHLQHTISTKRLGKTRYTISSVFKLFWRKTKGRKKSKEKPKTPRNSRGFGFGGEGGI